MFKSLKAKTMMLLCATSLLAATAIEAAQHDIDNMLATADSYRLQQDAAKVVSVVRLYKNGELDSTRTYHVYLREERQSLVVFKSRVEAGQKMLMLGDNYWLLMPKSRRPIRITPMQKLLGEASVGDISTLTWSDDYQGRWLRAETLTDSAGNQVDANLLELTSVSKGASYQRIELWLESGSNFPLKASLYLRSGKLAKRAWYQKGERNGQVAVTAMRLNDAIQKAKQTDIEYQSVEAMRLDDKFYNPSYLTRNKTGGL